MFLLVKQVSKSSATLEQTQEPAPKPCRYVNCHGQTAENELATHTHLSPIILLLMRKSEKAGLSTSRRSQHPEQTPLDSCYLPLLQVAPCAPAEVRGPPPFHPLE